MNDVIYMENGLEYCPICHKPRQRFFPAWGEVFVVPVMCDCDAAEKAERDARLDKMTQAIQLDRLRDNSLMDWATRSYTFANDDGKCPKMSVAYNYVKQWPEMYRKGAGLLLWGNVGTGKSFIAGSIANALLDQGVSVIMTNFPRILNALFCGDKIEFLSKLNRCSLLVIDDFGVERDSEYALEQVYSVIDSRYRSRKPLIITTNLNLKEMMNPPDLAHRRIYDRIRERCVPVKIDGENRRLENAEKNLDEVKELLFNTDSEAK